MNGGLSLTISPLFSLGANQEEKLSCVPFHIDEYRSIAEQKKTVLVEINGLLKDEDTLQSSSFLHLRLLSIRFGMS